MDENLWLYQSAKPQKNYLCLIDTKCILCFFIFICNHSPSYLYHFAWVDSDTFCLIHCQTHTHRHCFFFIIIMYYFYAFLITKIHKTTWDNAQCLLFSFCQSQNNNNRIFRIIKQMYRKFTENLRPIWKWIIKVLKQHEQQQKNEPTKKKHCINIKNNKIRKKIWIVSC